VQVRYQDALDVVSGVGQYVADGSPADGLGPRIGDHGHSTHAAGAAFNQRAQRLYRPGLVDKLANGQFVPSAAFAVETGPQKPAQFLIHSLLSPDQRSILHAISAANTGTVTPSDPPLLSTCTVSTTSPACVSHQVTR